MPSFRIHHVTRYTYDDPVKESVGQLRIFPRQDAAQQVISETLILAPTATPAFYTDYFGNRVADYTLLDPLQSLVIDSRIVVETGEPAPPNDPGLSVAELGHACSNSLLHLLLSKPEATREQWIIRHMLADIRQDAPGQTAHALVWACSEFIYRHFRYVKGITTVETSLDQILDHRSGVCQDFAHVCLQLLRTAGIPARYVSGYICPNRSGMRGEGATHAWVEYYNPALGWVGIDPTNNIWVTGHHIALATGRHFDDCSPVKGSFRGIARQQLSVYVSVGYEDGHVFEDLNQIRWSTEADSASAARQSVTAQAQQQQ